MGLSEVEDELLSVERIYEAGQTQNNLTIDKLASKRHKLDNLQAKIERQKRVLAEQTDAKETLEKETRETEDILTDLAQTLKLNDKMVAGVQTRVYDQIKKKIKLRIDGSVANRQYEFANNFLAQIEEASK